jgi:predicted lipoprotein with Yx(FWY)xxD motif
MTIGMWTRLRLGGMAGFSIAVVALLAGCGSSGSSSTAARSATSAAAAAPTGGAVVISSTKGANGTYLTGASGRALYLWMADTGGRSNCSGQCAKFWPQVVTKTTPSVSDAASGSDIATVTRADGSKQVTYKGHPLYYFLEDSSAGSVKGQGSNNFGAKWWLVTPSGVAITKASGSGAAGSSSTGGVGSAY